METRGRLILSSERVLELDSHYLELHLMRMLLVGKRELRLQERLEHGLLGVGLDGSQELLVHSDLCGLALLVDGVFLLLGVEELAVGGLLLLGLDAVEEGIVQVLRHADFAQIDLSARGDHVDLIDASQRAAVALVGSRHQKKTRLQLLEEDDVLSSVAASEEDEDSAGRDRRAQLVLVLREALLAVGPQLLRLVLGRVEFGESLNAALALATVLVALDLLDGNARGLLGLALFGLLLIGLPPFLDVPETTLVEHAAAGQAHDAALLDLAVDGNGARRLRFLSSWRGHFLFELELAKPFRI